MSERGPARVFSGADICLSVAERMVRATADALAGDDTPENRERAALARRNLVRVLTMGIAAKGGEL